MSHPISLDIWAALWTSSAGWYTVKASQIDLSVKVNASESRCQLVAPLSPGELSEISNRTGTGAQMHVIVSTKLDGGEFGSTDWYWVFNAKEFSFAEGGKSSSVTVYGAKYLPAATPAARTLSRYVSKDRQKLGATYRTVYRVHPLDIINWNPGDTIGGDAIKSININWSARSANASIEVQET